MRKRYRGNQRCMICDTVSSQEISHDYGEVSHGGFYLLSDKVTLVCAECMESINLQRFGYQLDDEEAERNREGLEGMEFTKMVVHSRENLYHKKSLDKRFQS